MKKVSFQSIFCYLSFLFILSCCVFYGTRLVKLYLDNEKVKEIEKNSLVKVIRESNSDNDKFKEINKIEYFTDDSDNNYLVYSNILWRIIRINNDNSITAISDNSLTRLANGKNKSHINKWLNITEEEISGILEKNLNNIDKYLTKTKTCLDKVTSINNSDCIDYNTDNYFSLLSVTDFVNIGNKQSFVINNEDFYLNDYKTEEEIWYISSDGKILTSTGNDIMSVRPVITIKENIDYISGNGTKSNPYVIEKDTSIFGSYVKLDKDIWRVYQIDDNSIKLVLNDYIKINNNYLEYIYSNNNSYYDSSLKGSIAYYLNHNYLDTLSYKDKIKETKWANGFYNSNDDYDFKDSLTTTVNSKVALLSIGDILFNNTLFDYFTMTGTSIKSTSLYTIQKDTKVYTKNISTSLHVVPTISIDKDLLTKGTGTIDDPFSLE